MEKYGHRLGKDKENCVEYIYDYEEKERLESQESE